MATIQRKNTVKIVFTSEAQRPTALEIHNWIDETLQITADQIEMIQLNTLERSIYIKLVSVIHYDRLMNKYTDPVNFRYNNGTIVKVALQRADVNTVTVRLFNLPQIDDNTVIQSLSSYGTVKHVCPEVWSTQYKYPVRNGVRAVRIEIKKHIPIKLVIACYAAILHYPGQPQLCHICGEESHLRSQCPNKKFNLPVNITGRKLVLSDVVRDGSSNVLQSTRATEEEEAISKESKQENMDTNKEEIVEEETDTSSETEMAKSVAPTIIHLTPGELNQTKLQRLRRSPPPHK
ncbi:hypothetical protein ANN_00980 [Periplaneta americana]|uniref:CCHC-type domain-containing protein n=1 Tax=Periplaneta americana TaxID=6978 RepID=A0ABQ8TSA3_PERAM|nr:hypothetical protein ANN_00980 [Periplaneta americana]